MREDPRWDAIKAWTLRDERGRTTRMVLDIFTDARIGLDFDKLNQRLTALNQRLQAGRLRLTKPPGP